MIDFFADLLILLLAAKTYSRGRRCRSLDTSLDIVVGTASNNKLDLELVGTLRCSILVELEKLCCQAATIIIPTFIEGVEDAHYGIGSGIRSSCKEDAPKLVAFVLYLISVLLLGCDCVLE